MESSRNFVREVRKATGEIQEKFAQRLGVSVRSLKRYEKHSTLPQTEAVRRALFDLAKKHGIEF